MLSGLKLTAGQAWAAWRRYPALRRELALPVPGAPILVTGMYRTGTTWVGAMLSAAGLWPIHEPFNPNQGLWRDELAYAPAADPRPDIDRLVSELIAGGHESVVRIPYADRWFSPLRAVPSTPRRLLVKDPSAALLSEYLVRRHGMRALVVYRHPGAVAASFVRLRWPTGRLVGRLLASNRLMEDWLAPRAPTMEAAIGRSDWFSGAVLYGCLAEVLLGMEGRNKSMTGLSFEDLCGAPVERFRELHGALGIPWNERVRRAHERMTEVPEPEPAPRPHGVRRPSAAMADQWRAEVSERACAEVRDAWERFDTSLYRRPSDWRVGAER